MNEVVDIVTEKEEIEKIRESLIWMNNWTENEKPPKDETVPALAFLNEMSTLNLVDSRCRKKKKKYSVLNMYFLQLQD